MCVHLHARTCTRTHTLSLYDQAVGVYVAQHSLACFRSGVRSQARGSGSTKTGERTISELPSYVEILPWDGVIS